MSGRLLGKKQPQFGFSMIEVLVAMFLMVIAILSIMGLIAAGMKVDNTSNNNSEATVIAKGLMEQMYDYQDFNSVQNAYNDSTSTRRQVNYNGDITSYTSNLSVSTTPAPLSPYLKKYVVTVYWNAVGSSAGAKKEGFVQLVSLRRSDDF